MSNEEWRQRPTYSRTLTYCEHCKTLQEDVRERRNFWPNVSMLSCEKCFKASVNEASGSVVY